MMVGMEREIPHLKRKKRGGTCRLRKIQRQCPSKEGS